ncbi:MAG TPA: hypothetical protein VK899_05350 [Gemmatimonadales bacterium]|nr:hypothetical protein [Gemmatimonadales bacterium]
MRNQQRQSLGVRWIAALGAVALLAAGAASAAAAPGGAQPAVKGPAGMQVFTDQATGKVRPATPQEVKMMSARLKAFLNRSSEGLKMEESANGTVSMNLQGGFLNVWVASLGTDGKITNACVTDQAAAQSILSGQNAPAYEEQ